MPLPNPNPKEEAEQKQRQQQQQQPSGTKRKRNLPGTPDPDAEVVALSPKTLLSASTFPCEVCGKEFRRDQNLQIHRRGHNLPWRRRPQGEAAAAAKKVYICPEAGCVYHEASRALGDLTGIKKHYSRKHGEKRWGCERCSKRYAVRTDWKAHSRVCGSRREYECACCGTLFSNKDSFIIHKASCGDLPPPEEDQPEAKAVNNELMFPSLWGKTKSEPELATQEAAPAGAQSKLGKGG